MEKNIMIRFTMNKIVVEQFAILTDTIPTSESDIKFETNLTFKADTLNRLIACEAKFIFEDIDKPFMKLDVQCQFVIEQSDWDTLSDKNKKIIITKGFLCHIATHTVGTARGILHLKTESTPFNVFIIPPINVENIVTDDFEITTK